MPPLFAFSKQVVQLEMEVDDGGVGAAKVDAVGEENDDELAGVTELIFWKRMG
jgi:hypothetical protein